MTAAPDLDPLELDRFYAETPLAGRHPAVATATLHAATRRACRLRALDAGVAVAVLRDLDPLLCATETHRVGVWQTVPGLERVLLACGRAADHIPRGDNATYGRYNPASPRTRTFTHTPQEHALYRGLAVGESRLDELLDGLAVCLLRPVDSAEHAAAAVALADRWEPMIDAAKLMRKAQVAPVMGAQIAPWVSHTFTIGGRPYRGPTAAQLPVVLVDWLIWGADTPDDCYRAYHRYYAAEQPSSRRQLIGGVLAACGGRSLLRKIGDELPAVRDQATACRSLQGLEALLRRMHGFRAAHVRFAKPSLPIREEGEESWGSGEFDPEMLDRLLRHTVTARRRVDEMLSGLV